MRAMLNIATHVQVATAAETEAFGAVLAERLTPGWTFHLCAQLGAGKTTLVRGVLRGLGFSGPVRSPTYTLVESYCLRGLAIYHMDFYRIESPAELEFIGVRELLGGSNVCFIEWPERGALPEPDVRVRISGGDAGRHIELDGRAIQPRLAPAVSP